MAQMQREQEQTEHIKARHNVVLETVNHHRIDIRMVERIGFQEQKARINFAHGEMENVKNDKTEDDKAGDDHVTGSEGRFYVVFSLVMHRARAAIFDRQTDRVENVQEHVYEEKDPDGPEQGTESTQMLRVAVYPIRSEKNLQIPKKMSDNEHDQNETGHRYNHFLADR